MSAKKIDENVANILICYFSKQIYTLAYQATLAHQTEYLHIED